MMRRSIKKWDWKLKRRRNNFVLGKETKRSSYIVVNNFLHLSFCNPCTQIKRVPEKSYLYIEGVMLWHYWNIPYPYWKSLNWGTRGNDDCYNYVKNIYIATMNLPSSLRNPKPRIATTWRARASRRCRPLQGKQKSRVMSEVLLMRLIIAWICVIFNRYVFWWIVRIFVWH